MKLSSTPIVISDESDDDDPPRRAKVPKSQTDRKGKGRAIDHHVPAASASEMDAREDTKSRLAHLDSEIAEIEAQLEPLQLLHASLTAERKALESQLKSRPRFSSKNLQATLANAIDYQSSAFPFSPAALQTLKNTFDLSSFRLCQEGVINAALDDRDIVCVMPTGGGKSLTYQLPAVMGRGLTVVISPLLALIWDQVRGLREIGIECVMFTGSMSTQEQNEIFRRLRDGPDKGEKEIRLCYVTPEKVSKSKKFISTLEKMNSSGRLRRFVIDEAHCCSQLGHDFRPDYKNLSMLKTLFPRVPIQAVTATLSSKTMPDLLKILQLGPTTDGRAAKTSGTVFFSAPLFRPNLHYAVLPKPSSAQATIAAIGGWIQQKHKGESGIVYCLSKKDAETVARELKKWSGGGIKTGVYHAGVDDALKERIHIDWREGKVNCICATIAFGLGIDKGDVRYVVHHSMSKSLEGYYQETGRAGRDGKPSDCILFYRGQDAARLAGLIYKDVDGTGKLSEMLKFAQDLKTCRKIAFAKYFSSSASVSTSAWDHPTTSSSTTSFSKDVSTCGICDNCRRPETAISTRDVTLEAWKILRIGQMVKQQKGRVTLQSLGNLVRGLGGGSFVIGSGKEKDGGTVDVKSVGGKVAMSADDVEILLIHLQLLGYLKESYHATSFTVNVYVLPSDTAIRLTRLSQTDIENGKSSIKITCTFPQSSSKEKLTGSAKRKKVSVGSSAEKKAKKTAMSSAVKKKAKLVDSSEDDEGRGEGEEYFSEVPRTDDSDHDGNVSGAAEMDEMIDSADWDDMIGDGWTQEDGWKVLGAGVKQEGSAAFISDSE